MWIGLLNADRNATDNVLWDVDAVLCIGDDIMGKLACAEILVIWKNVLLSSILVC